MMRGERELCYKVNLRKIGQRVIVVVEKDQGLQTGQLHFVHLGDQQLNNELALRRHLQSAHLHHQLQDDPIVVETPGNGLLS